MIKLGLYIPLRHTGGVEVQIHSLITLALDGGKWSTSSPDRFTAGYPINMRLGGFQRRSGRSGENGNLIPLPEFDPRLPQHEA